MISSPGSGKWVLGVFIAILLAVTLCFPDQVLFMLKFVGDIIWSNLQSFYQSFFKH